MEHECKVCHRIRVALTANGLCDQCEREVYLSLVRAHRACKPPRRGVKGNSPWWQERLDSLERAAR